MGADELRGNSDGGVEVMVIRRVEGQGRDDGTAVGVPVVRVDAADAEEGPSRRISSVRDAVGGGLQEIDLVFWVCLGCAGQDDEELEKDAAGKQNYGEKSEDRSW